MHTKKGSFDNKVVQAVLCHSSVVGSVIYEDPLDPGSVSKIKEILPVVPDISPLQL
jgi:hypothetical protein